MSDISFETALGERVEDMLDACTRCGKCVEVCPSVKPGGIPDTRSEDIISGVLDLVRRGDGPEASRKWAASCMLSGECIKACDYGVNPRFLLAIARLGIAKAEHELPDRRRQGVERYRDIRDVLGVTYQVMGGPSHCCGIMQLRPGDIEISGRMGSSTMEKLSHSKSGQVISWCPSCYVQFTELTLPTIERQGGSRPFEITPFIRFLDGRLVQLKPYLQRRVEMRVALHRHPGLSGVMEAAAEILGAIPGVELVDLKQPAVGLQSASVG